MPCLFKLYFLIKEVLSSNKTANRNKREIRIITIDTKNINNVLDKKKIEGHFSVYELAKRYAVEAASELNDLGIEFGSRNLTKMDIEQELRIKFKSKPINNWKTAMYQALYQDQCYCSGGYSKFL